MLFVCKGTELFCQRKVFSQNIFPGRVFSELKLNPAFLDLVEDDIQELNYSGNEIPVFLFKAFQFIIICFIILLIRPEISRMDKIWSAI